MAGNVINIASHKKVQMKGKLAELALQMSDVYEALNNTSSEDEKVQGVVTTAIIMREIKEIKNEMDKAR